MYFCTICSCIQWLKTNSLFIGAPDLATVQERFAEGKQLDTRARNALSGQPSQLEIEDILVRLDTWLQDFEHLIQMFSADDLADADNQGLNVEMRHISRRMDRIREQLRHHLTTSKEQYTSPVIRTGTVGRPRYHITEEQLTLFHNLGFTWAAMARMLGK